MIPLQLCLDDESQRSRPPEPGKAHLPVELIQDIAYIAARNNTADALAVALASHCTYLAALNALYRTVSLPTLFQVARFCMCMERTRHMSRTRVLALGYRQWLDVSLYQSLVRAAPGVTSLYCPLDVFIDPTAPIVCSPSSLMLVSADRVDTWPPAHALPFSNLQRLYLESLPCDADVWLDDATVALLTQLTHYGCRTSSDYVWTVDTMVEHLRPIRALPSLRIILLHSHFFLQSPYTNLGGWFDEVAKLKDPRIYASPSSLSLQVWLSIQDDPQSDWWETSGVQVWSG